MYIRTIHIKEKEMNASVVDLRYKMKDILKALDRKEEVNIIYHGKVKGVIKPVEAKSRKKISAHDFFGMTPDIDVAEEMKKLRGGRYRGL